MSLGLFLRMLVPVKPKSSRQESVMSTRIIPCFSWSDSSWRGLECLSRSFGTTSSDTSRSRFRRKNFMMPPIIPALASIAILCSRNCVNGDNSIHNHDRVKDQTAKILSYCGLSTKVEEQNPFKVYDEENGKRPDITIFNHPDHAGKFFLGPFFPSRRWRSRIILWT